MTSGSRVRRTSILLLTILVAASSASAVLQADFDGNGSVDFFDLFLFVDQMGEPVGPDNEAYDLNEDVRVDIFDFFLFVDDFGKSEEAAPNDVWQQVPLRSANQLGVGITGGEGMQLIYGLSYAPSNSQIAYMVSDVSQVWKSTDGGASWKRAHKGFLANGGLSVVVHPSDEDLALIAGSTQESFSDEEADGIYRTTDGGGNWSLVRATSFVNLQAEKGGVNFAFAGEDTVYAGTHAEGLLRSTDSGETWEPLGLLTDARVLDLKSDPGEPAAIFVAAETGLFRYEPNNPATVDTMGSNLPDFPRSVVVRPDDPGILLVSVGHDGVWRSTDGGNTFSDASVGLDALDADPPAPVTYLAMSPVDPDHLYVSFLEFGGNQPYHSRDGGITWQEPAIIDDAALLTAVNDLSGGEFLATPIAPNPDFADVAIASVYGNHIAMTSDAGASWSYSGSGYTGGRAGTATSSFGFDPNQPGRFAFFLVDYGTVLTEDGGETFRNLKAPRHGTASTPVGAIHPEFELVVTAAGSSPQILSAYDPEAETWTQWPEREIPEYTFIAFHPHRPDTIYANQFRSTDRGETWHELQRPVLALFPPAGDIVYSAEIAGDEVAVSKSLDAGETWTQPYEPLEVPEFYEVAVDPRDENRIYLTTGLFGIFVLEEGVWVNRSEADGLEADRFGGVPTRLITVDPVDPEVVYAGNWIAFRGHSNGIFRSTNSGVSWENISF